MPVYRSLTLLQNGLCLPLMTTEHASSLGVVVVLVVFVVDDFRTLMHGLMVFL